VVGFFGVPAALGGSNSFSEWLSPVFGAHEQVRENNTIELFFMALSVMVAAIGIGAAYLKYLAGRTPFVAREPRGVAAFAAGAFFVDEFYRRIIINPLVVVARGFLFRAVDVVLIDGAVNGVAKATSLFGGIVRTMQTGSVRTYLYYLGAGAAFLMVIIYAYAGKW
jgi:NADH-quinone oxidoreductase subunit L